MSTQGREPSSSSRSYWQIRLAAQETTTSGDYVVKRGDTLGRIAAVNKVAGGWKALVDKNPALKANPNSLVPGQRLSL